ISYNERNDNIVLLLPIIINSNIYRFENSIYNPFVEISVYNNPEAIFIMETLDKTEEDNKILKKFIIRANKFINYNIISIKDRY
ncbi:hypothetical protein NEUTE2DRAFT_68945, partial [Neurospora tetrasperma FGSC 2509]